MSSSPDGCEATSTSLSLLRQLHADNPEAWDRLVMLYAPLVWHWCRQMDLPTQEIADVFQDVFQSVAVHFPGFHRDRPGDTFRGWLRTITKNKVRDHFRARKREPQGAGGTEANAWWSRVPDLSAEIVEPYDDPQADRHLFKQALELVQVRIEEKTWLAFWGVVVEGCSVQEIADELGMSPGAVRVAKCRVLHRIRRELADLQD
jgi:RNA polymerase sigma-70 factor (ECF subfamily)